MKSYEFIEHTSDIAVRVYGDTLKELFLNAAHALFDLLVDSPPKENRVRIINIESDSPEDLLVYWLNELISLFYTYGFLPRSYDLSLNIGLTNEIKSSAKGEYLAVDKLKIKTEIKACTYHNLKIQQTHSGYKVDIIFDV